MSFHQPPKLPLRFFRWFCSEERVEELEGDLFEVYNELADIKGVRRANMIYCWLVIRSFRSFAFRKTNRTQSLPIMTHFKHNLLIAKRNLLKNKTTTAINLLGLTIGIAAFLGILTIVRYELSFNTQIPNKERVFRIYTSFSGSFSGTNPGVAAPVGPYIEENFKGLESITYFQTWRAKAQNTSSPSIKKFDVLTIAIATPAYFDVIEQYKWLAGNAKSLSQPNKVVLTNEQAFKYFGSKNWSDILGKELTYRDSLRTEVVGIVQPDKTNNDFNFTDFISHSTLEKTWLSEFFNNEWGNTNSSSQLFLKLQSQSRISELENHLQEVNAHAASLEEDADWITEYKAQPLTDLHFDPEIGIMDNGGQPAHLKTLLILSIVAFVILLIAIFNFINLETAQSTLKSKEVGVRKVLGGNRSLLLSRFLTESALITITSSLLAIPIVHFALKYFSEFLPHGLYVDYTNPFFWGTLLLIIMIVSLLAGVYPSWVISSFKPIKALKSHTETGRPGGAWVRKTLILLQFLFSQLLIFGTIIISWQISYMLDKELGFENDGILTFHTPYYAESSKRDVLLNQLSEIPEITDFIVQGDAPVQNGYSSSTVKFDTPNGQEIINVHNKRIHDNYLEFYGIELMSGNPLLPNDTLPHMLINESFMRKLGFENPQDAIDAQFIYGTRNHYVRGVVKDFHFQSLHHHIEPMIFKYSEGGRAISLKVASNNVSTVIDEITSKWDNLYEEQPLNISFMNETIERFYQTEQRASKLASAATVISILISCLGLFGLISFTIVRKTKEIGIRKVLGASVYHLGTILSREFAVLIAIAFVIAVPIAYLFTMEVSDNFAYAPKISWWVYLLGGSISIVIAIATISIKIIKASKANPVDSLRYE